jgi:cytochrome P450
LASGSVTTTKLGPNSSARAEPFVPYRHGVNKTRPVSALLDDNLTVPVPSGESLWRTTQRAMARWSNGSDHARCRTFAITALSPLQPKDLRVRARTLTLDLLPHTTDLTALARTVPVEVLADALGFDEPTKAARHQRLVSIAFSPEDGLPPAVDADIDRSMTWLLASSGTPSREEAANRVALLHQCIDATAGLILNAYVHGVDHRDAEGEPDPSAALVTWALHHARPVVHTTRIDQMGKPTAVSLAGAPFGAGPHQCPGRDVAIALACGVLDGLRSATVGDRVRADGNEARANLRIPKLRIVP